MADVDKDTEEAPARGSRGSTRRWGLLIEKSGRRSVVSLWCSTAGSCREGTAEDVFIEPLSEAYGCGPA